MITRLHTPLLDSHGGPLSFIPQDGRPSGVWTTKAAILAALFFDGQPKEFVEASVTIAEIIEALPPNVDEVLLPAEQEVHLLSMARNSLPPLLYLRVKQACVTFPDETPQPTAMRMS